MAKTVARVLGLVIILAAGAGVWQFGIRPRMARYQAWQGVIKEPFRLRDPKKDTYSPHGKDDLFYDHYWFVVLDGGEVIKVEVPRKLWLQSRAGQRVLKKSGERWPELIPMTEEDVQRAIEAGYIQEQPAVSEDASDEAGQAFLADNAKKPGIQVLPSGLQYKVIQQGDGPNPKATDRVKVHYRGTLLNGQEFDSSYARGEPAVFQLNKVIPGWTEAVQLMQPGAKWQIYVPAELAYGRHGAPPVIAPNQVLIFDIELIEIVPDHVPNP